MGIEQTGSPNDPSGDACTSFHINRTAHLLHLMVSATIKRANWPCSPEETQAMVFLNATGDKLRMNEFAALMMRDATTCKRQLDGLIEKGMVERTNCPKDRRVVLVSLSEEGRKRLLEIIPTLEQFHQDAFANIPPADIEATQRTLKQIQANLADAHNKPCA